MRRFSVSTASAVPDFAGEVLDEERIRDQLSVAEELVYVGHREPALVAAGAAVEGAVRLAAGPLAGYAASAGALLEALLAYRVIDVGEHEQLAALLTARDRVTHGFAIEDRDLAGAARLAGALGLVVRLLEPGPLSQSGN